MNYELSDYSCGAMPEMNHEIGTEAGGFCMLFSSLECFTHHNFFYFVFPFVRFSLLFCFCFEWIFRIIFYAFLGDMSPVWIDECAGVFLACFMEKDEILRASASQSLAELVFACRGRNLEKYIDEVKKFCRWEAPKLRLLFVFQILFMVERVLIFDDSAIVRRAGVNLLRQIVRSCETNIFEVVFLFTFAIWVSNRNTFLGYWPTAARFASPARSVVAL